MSRWTSWRKIADHQNCYPDVLDWDGPACYQLAIGGPRGGDLRIVYVGETVNEKKRLLRYAMSGSHLSEIIYEHLKRGWHLFYRARAAESKLHAQEMELRLLEQHDFDWNLRLNTWGK